MKFFKLIKPQKLKFLKMNVNPQIMNFFINNLKVYVRTN